MKLLITLNLLITLFAVQMYGATRITGWRGTCTGSTTYLNDTTSSSGSWYSSNSSIATISSSGAVYGVSSGTCIISYVVGLSVDTFAFTVSPATGAITGYATSYCPGVTDTLYCSPSGGVWSMYSWGVATIQSSTGIITAIRDGSTLVYYTMGPGCFSMANINVYTGGFGWRDTLTGPSTICLGSSGSFRTTVSGGSWNSSNPSIATVSSTGIVTGVSVGTANISYVGTSACGPTWLLAPVSISSTTPTATIYGATTVLAGTSTTLAVVSSAAGGVWSSSSPSIASIHSASGLVEAITAGSATISYTYTGCGGASTSTRTITVSPFTGISGYVHFQRGMPSWRVMKVWLIKLTGSTLSAIDSSTLSISNDSVYYQFLSAPTDTYRVKAHVLDTASLSTGYIPTYHDTSYYWFTARIIPHVSGVGDTRKDIYMAYGSTTTGPGFIGGSIYAGANKGTSGEIPVAGMRVIAVNQTTGRPAQTTLTNASGAFSFSNLPLGTYFIFPEQLGYRTAPYNSINITSSSSSFNYANFSQHTISKTITPNYVGVTNVAASNQVVSIYPNPAKNEVNVKWNATAEGTAKVVIADMTGRVLQENTINVLKGNNTNSVNTAGIANGTYIMTITNDGNVAAFRLEIAH